MARYPVAYIRRSSASENDPGDVSREVQETAVRDLAHRDGHNGNLKVFVDWARSADEAKESRRTEFIAMLKVIEKGEVDVVYAYALDRLYRSMRTFVRLTDAAREHDVRVVTQREGVLGGDGSPMAKAFAQITAVFSELELNTAKARARGGIASRRRRGDQLGKPGYGWRHVQRDDRVVVSEPDPDEPLDRVVAAYREAGSFAGAARILNAAGVPARHAPSWAGNTVARVVRRSAPDIVPLRVPVGRRSRQTHVLAGLVRCPCDQLMTARATYTKTVYGTFGPYVSYLCPRARYDAAHPRPYMVAEPALVDLLKAEIAAHLIVPETATVEGPDRTAQRAALEAKRGRWIEQYGEGLIDKAERDQRLARIAADLEELDRVEEAETNLPVPPSIDWEGWTSEALNRTLRLLLVEIKMTTDMKSMVVVPRLKRFWS